MDKPQVQSAHIEQWIGKQPSTEQPVEMSLVVPAFNEELRLPPTLIQMVDYLELHGLSYEIIVVDDGSSDQTSEMVRKFERIRPQIRLITVPRNQGKGFAVRTGVMNARGRYVTFADADGSTPIEEISRLQTALDAGAQVAIGSRALASAETRVVTRWYRKYLGRLFNVCVNLFLLPDIADTQCGFKMFPADVARFLFGRQKADRYSFDVELLYMAHRCGLKISEVPVNWHNVPGSKVNLVLDALKMFRDLFIFRVRHSKLSRQDYDNYTKSADARVP